LSVLDRHNPAYFPGIERIAWAYCEGDADPLLFEQALIIAENDMILMCVNAECLAAIERLRDPHALPFSDTKASFARARARFAQAQLAYAELVEATAKTSEAGKTVISNGKGVDSVPGKNSTRDEDATTGNAAVSHYTSAAQEPCPAARCAGPPRISLDWNVTDGAQPRAAIEPFVSSSSSGRCASFDCKLKECTMMGGVGENCCGANNRDVQCPAR
jgi:hypothetical protein